MATDPALIARLRIFPRDDRSFAQVVVFAVDRGGGVNCSPSRLQDLLRERYPAARVQVQAPLGVDGNRPACWYVFRDGRIMPTVRRTGAPIGSARAVFAAK